MSPVRQSFLDGLLGLVRPKRTNPSQAIGVGGTAVYGGYVQSNERDQRLQGRERYKTFSEILANTTIVAAAVRLFLNTVGKPEWKCEPAEHGARANEFAEKVEEALFDMTTPWFRVVKRAAMFQFHGFSVQEWTSKRRDSGMIGFLDVEARPQLTIEKWDLDASGTVHGLVQVSPQDYREIYLPRGRLVIPVDDALSDSPEGLGLFRHIAEAAKRLARYEQLEGVAFETDLRGIPIGRGPFHELQLMVDRNDISKEQKLAYEDGLRRFVSDHIRTHNQGILLDSKTYETTDESRSPSSVRQWEVELLNGDSQSHEWVAAAIERVNREIARVLGAEFLLLGSTGTGSLALSKDKTSNFVLIVESVLRDLVAVFESDLVDPIFGLNGWPMESRPSLKVSNLQTRDVGEVTGALRDLAQAASAVGPQDDAYMEVFDLLGLTRPKLEDHPIDLGLIGPEDLAPQPGMPTKATPAAEDTTPPAEEPDQE